MNSKESHKDRKRKQIKQKQQKNPRRNKEQIARE